MSSAGRRVALFDHFAHALTDLGLDGDVFAADMSRTAPVFQRAARGFIVPRCTAPEFIPRMLQICRDNDVKLVIPTIDTELMNLARHREAFAEIGTLVAISSPDTIRISSDKVHTWEWLTRHGFPTVRQATPEQVLADRDAWPLPLVAKPAGGSSSIGLMRVTDHDELIGLPPEKRYIVQSMAPGIELTISAFIDRSGRCQIAVPRRRLEVRSGEVSKGITVKSDAIESLVKRMCEALPGGYGPVNFQLFHDRASGQMQVIELNARFGGGCPLAITAGMISPTWLLEETLGRPLTEPATPWRGGLVMLRYDDAVFVDHTAAGLTADGWPA